MNESILIGISSCLLGEEVRFDGGHKRDRFITDQLGKYVTFYPICPEQEAGFGTPRESMRLENLGDGIKLISNKSKEDKTQQLRSWTEKRIEQIKEMQFCGYIFKSKSPSCGLFRVKVYNKYVAEKSGQGLWAETFTKERPLIPVEEEGRLHDETLRENFIERIFIVHRWYTYRNENYTISGLIDFHRQHKYLLMAHSPSLLKEMGQIVANTNDANLDEMSEKYYNLLIENISEVATTKKNVNVLHHILGYFKKDLASDEKAEVLEIIEQYHNKLIPLIVPVTLLNHFVRKYNQDYLQEQIYLHPHPKELMLRNHS